jgi:hypothetical protein
MSIEVRELIIKARVEDTPQNGGNGSGNSRTYGPSQTLGDRDLQKIVALCAEEVLQVLKRQKER